MAHSAEEKLHEAAKKGRASKVSTLLRDHPGINVNWTNKEQYQWTPLHAASNHGHVEVVKLLLAHPNIDVNLKSAGGQTPLSFAGRNGHASVVKLLLKDPRVNITLDDDNGCTPLDWASLNGRHKVIEWFIASGRDLGTRKENVPLKLPENTVEVKLCLCWRDSWLTQH